MGKLDVEMNNNSGVLNVKLNGSIDEDVNFSKYALSGAQAIELDLKGVTGINSCGIREWIKWLNSSAASKLKFHNCPKVIVDQINMVDGFLPTSAEVASFYVPYYNEDTGSEKNVLFRNGIEYSAGQINPPKVQDDDGNEMEMDIIENKYFKFLRRS